MTLPRYLFWHRRDLRLVDNLGLATAVGATRAVTGVFVLDQTAVRNLGRSRDCLLDAPARRWFLAESLRELDTHWRKAGSRLLVLSGDPVTLLPRLAEILHAEMVIWNRDVEPGNRERDRQTVAALQSNGCRILAGWDQLLITPEELCTRSGHPYRVYGPFWRNWRSQMELRDQENSGDCTWRKTRRLNLLDLSPEVEQSLNHCEPLATAMLQGRNCLEDLLERHGFSGVDICPCRPGEQAAWKQLRTFCDSGSLLRYKPKRDFPRDDGTSGLSAALRFGTISPRQVWTAVRQVRNLAHSHEHVEAIRAWEQELAWREFYQQAIFHFPELADGPYRSQWKSFRWANDTGLFHAWRQGLTGMPIVDAAMRQLRESGWMHNRCRMIAASFLVKDLICDWRWGEKAFMELLVDGDLAANNGGWQWSASSGMDPRPLRIFNPATQATKFDSDASYIRRWLPEIAHVATPDLLSGNIPAAERHGYPKPLVEHQNQQRRFKELYAAIRA